MNRNASGPGAFRKRKPAHHSHLAFPLALADGQAAMQAPTR